MGYDELVSRLEKRFHATELPQVLQMELSSAKQRPGESWHEFGNRLHLLSTKAYPDLSDAHIESHAVSRFCLGCSDRVVGRHVYTEQPVTINEAVNLAKRFEQAEKEFCRQREDVRQVVLDEEVVAVSRMAVPQSPLRPSRLDSMEHRVSREKIDSFEASTSSCFKDIQSSMQRMESVLTDLSVRVKTRDQRRTLHPPEKSDMKSPSQSPTRTSNGLCLTCKDHGHFARACPSMSVTVEGNEQGTEEMAPLCP